MPKSPSFQFYPKDWISDLQEHPLEIGGAWIRICCALFFEPSRGDAEKTLGQWAAILGTTQSRTRKILHYLLQKNIAKISKKNAKNDQKNDQKLVNQILTKKRNDFIYVASKRMLHDEYIRQIRKKSGSKGGNPALIQGDDKNCEIDPDLENQNQTPSSSSSSSSSNIDDITSVISESGADSVLSKKHFKHHAREYFDSIKTRCETIMAIQKTDNRNFNPWKFVQLETNKKRHPGAVDQTLGALIDHWESIKNPWPYSNAIMKTLNGNYNEADHIKRSQEFKKILDELTENMGDE